MILLGTFLVCLVANALLAVYWWEREQWVPFAIAVAGFAFALAGTAQLIITGG